MFNRNIYSKRIKLLRKSYKFTIVEFSTYFKLISKTTVGAWEKETAIPSADVLADLSTFFGISIDWFAGFSNTPYTKESIENAEKYVFDKLIEVDKRKLFLFVFPKEYLDPEQREKLYSLSVRANIVVLLHCFYIPNREDNFKSNSYKEEFTKTGVMHTITNAFIQYLFPPVYEVTSQKERTYLDNFYQILNRKITTPIYDIESDDLK